MAKAPSPYANAAAVTNYPGVTSKPREQNVAFDPELIVGVPPRQPSRPAPEWARDWEQADVASENNVAYTPPPMVTAERGIDVDGLVGAQPASPQGRSDAGHPSAPAITVPPLTQPARQRAKQRQTKRRSAAPPEAPAYPGTLAPPLYTPGVVTPAPGPGVAAQIGAYPELTEPGVAPPDPELMDAFEGNIAGYVMIHTRAISDRILIRRQLVVDPQELPGILPRTCCLLEPEKAVDGTKPLGPHEFDHLGFFGTPVDKCGNLLTDRAGLVDLGHVRDHADMTVRIFRQIVNSQRKAARAPIRTNHGNAVLRGSATGEDILDAAAAIAYDDGWAYEIYTYHVPIKGNYNSAFSPEDLVSNYLGTLAARRAIVSVAGSKDLGLSGLGGLLFSDQEISQAIELELEKLKDELGARSLADARATLRGLEGIWFKTERMQKLGHDDYLQRRNFRSEPWSPSASLVLTPPWRNAPDGHPAEFARIRSRYHYVFDYTLLDMEVPYFIPHKRFDGERIPALTDAVRKSFLKSNPNYSDKP